MAKVTLKTIKESHDYSPINIRRPWSISESSACTVDDLIFTGRDGSGRMEWWTNTAPKTNYWHAHEQTGRAHAFDLLDLIHNKQKKGLGGHEFCCIAEAICRQYQLSNDGMAHGFFSVISEFLINGKADR